MVSEKDRDDQDIRNPAAAEESELPAEPKPEQGGGPDQLGTLPLRNSVLFPHAVMPISVGRRKTLALIENALENDLPIAVVSQHEASVDDPTPDDLYKVGTRARILKAIRVGGGNINLIIQGVERVEVEEFSQLEPFITCRVKPLPNEVEEGVEVEALARNLTQIGRAHV